MPWVVFRGSTSTKGDLDVMGLESVSLVVQLATGYMTSRYIVCVIITV